MTRSSIAARAAHTDVPSTSALEDRLRTLLGQHHLGLSADELVGYVSRIDDLGGEPDLPMVRVRASLVAYGARAPRLGRAFHLDPYTMQVLIDDARRAGRGARLDVVVASNTPGVHVDAVRRRLAALGRHGVDVRIRPERRRRDYSFLYAV